MPKFKDGDSVQVKVREVQGKEAFEGGYAPHLGGTRGTILKVYSPQEVAVDLDIDSLPESVRHRHAEQQSAMHEKWLNSLSEEARNRLTDEEKSFRLRYVVLLSEADLEPLKESARISDRSKQSASKASRGGKIIGESAPTRPTPAQLDQLEEQYLKARRQR
ncbi:MAG: hypothetical protein C4336_00390 [Armatimonadota bacterium]